MKSNITGLSSTSRKSWIRVVKLVLGLTIVLYFTSVQVVQTHQTEAPTATATASGRTMSTRCRQNQRCSYRISKLVENEYNMVRGIMENLMNAHWNVTLEFVNLYMDVNLKVCDQYMDNMAVDKVLARDFRHPNALFRALDDDNKTNQSVREQYEAAWFEKYKLIKPKLHTKLNVQKCNALGLKLHALMYQYPERANSSSLLRCTSERNEDTLASTLIDFYISQTFMKSCLGNLELLAMSIRRLLKFDCERAHKFKIAYYTSKYLNMFRTCDPYLTIGDLMMNESVRQCTNKELNGTINKKYCSWFELVCKYPAKCFAASSSSTAPTTLPNSILVTAPASNGSQNVDLTNSSDLDV